MILIRRFFLMATALVLASAAFYHNASPLFSQEIPKTESRPDCDYDMCQFEKDNIDQIILERAKTCQTVIFGEIHDRAMEGMPAPVEDSRYVITLLPEFKKIGYEYFALEVKKNASEGSHSNDMVRFDKTYRKEKNIHAGQFPNAKPGWIELLKTAIDKGYQIRFIDVAVDDHQGCVQRDKAMFETIVKEIFTENREARVIVYVGASHVAECETHSGISLCAGKTRPLGYFLNHFTKGKNFSVYMGHTYDTPVGCDLFLSYFIWETYQKNKTPKRIHP